MQNSYQLNPMLSRPNTTARVVVEDDPKRVLANLLEQDAALIAIRQELAPPICVAGRILVNVEAN